MSSGDGIKVLTVNLCAAFAGITNRHLPKALFAVSVLAVAGLLLLACACTGLPWWLIFAAAPILFLVTLVCFGLPLARLSGPFLQFFFGLDDFKRERVDLFVRMLRSKPEWADIDVICVQECYNGVICPGGYPEQLVQGAHACGFVHAAVPDRLPVFPATLAQNSGLLILSRLPIVRSAALTFGLHAEAGGVNRGALHAELEGGMHIFTCHISPTASTGGAFGALLTPLFDGARSRQVLELAKFVERCAPAGAPVVLAGDFNLDLQFLDPAEPPVPSRHAIQLLATLRQRCSLLEAMAWVRGGKEAARAVEPTLRHFRPTFGYMGGPLGGGGEPETWLTSYGNGRLRTIGDDAVLFRGFQAVAASECSLLVSKDERPHPRVTHASDHWALCVHLARLEEATRSL